MIHFGTTAISSARVRLSLAFMVMVVSVGPALATDCQSYNAATSDALDGACAVDYVGDEEVITIGQTKFVFVQKDRQGQWSTGTLNGEPAVRYEINRSTYSYSTLDLTLFLDRTDE